MATKKTKNKGFFITFEGIEGSGKSTHIKLLKSFLIKKGLKVITTKEPGGSSIGKKIREILLNPLNKNLTSKTELFLLLADRAQHTYEKIKPFLEKGYIVISDRFIDSSVAYQGAGRKIKVNIVKKLNQFATDNLLPDITILMDVNVSKGLISARKKDIFLNGDRIERENLSFHKRVQAEYHKLAKEEPKRFIVININKDINSTQKIIRDIIIKKLKERGLIL